MFAWKQVDETLNQIRGWYLEWARQAILRIFEEIASREEIAECPLHQYFKELPDWAVTRFLSAPETYNRAKIACSRDRNDLTRHVLFFQNSLRAERMLSGTHDAPGACWSALGDFYFAGSESVDPRRQQWNPAASFAAPRVGGVPIDFASAHSWHINSLPDLPFVPYTPQEATLLCSNLESAFDKVVSVSDRAARLFTNFVAVVVPRKNPLRPRSSGSSSTPSHVGRLLLRNGHLMDVARLAETLVHEAIHSILDVLETSEPFADHPQPPNKNILVRSPWTNNEIPLRIYVHACFVWYGLVKFWKAALQRDVLPVELVNRQLAVALTGFKPADPVNYLLPYRDTIRPSTLEVASSLRKELESSHDLG
jgi:hypothetical protein